MDNDGGIEDDENKSAPSPTDVAASSAGKIAKAGTINLFVLDQMYLVATTIFWPGGLSAFSLRLASRVQGAGCRWDKNRCTLYVRRCTKYILVCTLSIRKKNQQYWNVRVCSSIYQYIPV
jgi:hypothetical protein